MVQDGQGNTEDAMFSEGEIVFSLPAIVAAGKGDFEKGAQLLLELHDTLREESKQYLGEQGLASVGGMG